MNVKPYRIPAAVKIEDALLESLNRQYAASHRCSACHSTQPHHVAYVAAHGVCVV